MNMEYTMDGKVGMTMRMELHAHEKTENQRVSIDSMGSQTSMSSILRSLHHSKHDAGFQDGGKQSKGKKKQNQAWIIETNGTHNSLMLCINPWA